LDRGKFLRIAGYVMIAAGVLAFVIGLFQVLPTVRIGSVSADTAAESANDDRDQVWVVPVPSWDSDFSSPDTDSGGGWDSGFDDWDWGTDSGAWDGGGWDSGSWDSGGWDSGSDSGSWDSGGWDSGGSDSGSW
jgi:hypothetical protein